MTGPTKQHAHGGNPTTRATLTWWIATSQWRQRNWPRYHTESRTHTRR